MEANLDCANELIYWSCFKYVEQSTGNVVAATMVTIFENCFAVITLIKLSPRSNDFSF